MKGQWFKFENKEVYLEPDEMYKVHEHYVVHQNADYLQENYPHLVANQIMEMAWSWRDKELQEGYSNEDALAEVLEEYGLED